MFFLIVFCNCFCFTVGCRNVVWCQKFGSKRRDEMSPWNVAMKCHHETSQWNIEMKGSKCRNETSQRNFVTKLRNEPSNRTIKPTPASKSKRGYRQQYRLNMPIPFRCPSPCRLWLCLDTRTRWNTARSPPLPTLPRSRSTSSSSPHRPSIRYAGWRYSNTPGFRIGKHWGRLCGGRGTG